MSDVNTVNWPPPREDEVSEGSIPERWEGPPPPVFSSIPEFPPVGVDLRELERRMISSTNSPHLTAQVTGPIFDMVTATRWDITPTPIHIDTASNSYAETYVRNNAFTQRWNGAVSSESLLSRVEENSEDLGLLRERCEELEARCNELEVVVKMLLENIDKKET